MRFLTVKHTSFSELRCTRETSFSKTSWNKPELVEVMMFYCTHCTHREIKVCCLLFKLHIFLKNFTTDHRKRWTPKVRPDRFKKILFYGTNKYPSHELFLLFFLVLRWPELWSIISKLVSLKKWRSWINRKLRSNHLIRIETRLILDTQLLFLF